MKIFLLTFFFMFLPFSLFAQTKIVVVELNAENMFDVRHDSLKNDTEFLPNGMRHWTKAKY